MGQTSAFDVLTGTLQQVPRVDVVVAGVECRSASMLNLNRSKLRHCVREMHGSTGATVNGLRQYCQKHFPQIVIVENVPGLGKTTHASSERPDSDEVEELANEVEEDNLGALVRPLVCGVGRQMHGLASLCFLASSSKLAPLPCEHGQVMHVASRAYYVKLCV